MIHTSQMAVPSTAATLLAVIPAGEVVTVLTNGSTSATVYFGGAPSPGTGVTSSTGHPIPPGATITLPGLRTSSGGTLYAVASPGTATTGVTLVTDG
jgi:hypothetical protein